MLFSENTTCLFSEIATYLFSENATFKFPKTLHAYFPILQHICFPVTFNCTLHIKEMYSDTIFSFNDKGIHTPKYILELGNLNIPQDIRNWDFERFRNSIGRDFFFVNEIYETDKYLVFKYNHDNKRINLMIFNKQTGEIDNFPENERSGGINNDVDGGPNFIPEHNDNNIFLQKINAFELKTHVESEAFKNSTPKYPEKKKELEELAATLDENDNPVLMLVKLKD